LTTLRALATTLGAKLDGVLVLDARAMPAQVPSPDLAVPLGTETQPRHPWNAAGTGFSHERFPFAIVLLGLVESAAVLMHGVHAGASVGSGNRPLVELRYPMSARGDAPSCLASETCLPLGGQSVWGSLEPRTAPDTELLRLGKPAVALTASLDATGFFHETAPGANAAVASLVAVLAAVDAVVSDPALASQLGSLPNTALFFLFTGEAWGELGSRRLLTDVRNFTCATPHAPPPPPSAPSGAPSQRPPLPAPSSCQVRPPSKCSSP
jgi:nicastrin